MFAFLVQYTKHRTQRYFAEERAAKLITVTAFAVLLAAIMIGVYALLVRGFSRVATDVFFRDAVVYYATVSSVYVSMDAGENFDKLPALFGEVGSGNIAITAIDSTVDSGSNIVVAAVIDGDAGQFGGVYIYGEQPDSGWRNRCPGCGFG